MNPAALHTCGGCRLDGGGAVKLAKRGLSRMLGRTRGRIGGVDTRRTLRTVTTSAAEEAVAAATARAMEAMVVGGAP